MARRIKIRWLSSNYRVGRDDGYRVRIEVLCAEEMPEEIFVYRQMPVNPATMQKAGFFSHIASPVDLEEMPADEPRIAEVPEWFRLNYVDILVRSTEEAEAFINDVKEDVCRLKKSLDRLDTISPRGVVACGDPFACESSESSLSSMVSSISSESVSLGEHSRTCHGTTELAVGYGQDWASIGTGAGSAIGDSIGSDSRNASRTTLLSGLVSKQLVIRGFTCFDDIPDDAVITGVEALLSLRHKLPATSGSSESSSSSSASPEPFQGPVLLYFRLYHPDLGPVGDDKAASNPIQGPGWHTIGLGSPTDEWGTVLTGKLVKRGSFGIMLIVYLPATGPSDLVGCSEATPSTQGVEEAIVEIDGVDLTLYWSS